MTAPKKSMLQRKIDGATKKFIAAHEDKVVDMVRSLFLIHGVRPSSRTILYKLKKLGHVTKADDKKVEALVAYLKLIKRIHPNMMKDAKRSMYGTTTFDDKADALNQLIEEFKLDAWEGQPNKVLVMCEAVGYLDVISKVAKEYRCDYIPSGGDFSIHWKIKIAQQDYTHIVYAGDMDKKGLEISDTILADINAQRSEYGLENITVVRLTFDADVWGVELEGVDVEFVREMVKKAIVDLIEMEDYEDILSEEEDIIAELEAEIERMPK